MTDNHPPNYSLSYSLWSMFKRDLSVAVRHRGDMANPLVFFLLVLTMVPLGVSPDPAVLSMLAPGMLWVIALLATLLSLDGLFRQDFDDGSLEQMVISPQPLYALVLVKIAVHWLTIGLPLTVIAPLLGGMMALPADGYLPLLASLALGSGSLSLIGAIGSALTVSLRKGGLLLSLVIMPFYVPVLIFGASSVKAAIDGFPYSAQLAILGAMFAMAIILAPFAIAGALRMSVNN